MFRAATAYVVLYATMATYAPFLQQYYLSLGIPVPWIGVLAGFTSGVAFVASPIWGAVNDHFPGSRWVIPLAAAFGTVGSFGLFLVGNSPLIVPTAAVWAMGMSGTIPMLDVRVLSMVAANRTRYAWIRACGSIGFMVCAPLVGALIDARGMAALFVLLVPGIALAGAASITLPVRPDSVRGASIRKAPGVVLRQRTLALYFVGSLVAWSAIQAQALFISIYLEELGAPSSVVGWTWTVSAAMEVPIMIGFPWLARRFGLERLILAGAGVLVVRQLANVLITNPYLLLVCSMLQGLGFALVLIGGIMFVSLHAPKGTAATAQGILNSTGSLASIAAGAAGGLTAGIIGIRGLFAVSVCLGVVAIGLFAVAVIPVARAGKLEMAPSADDARESAEGPAWRSPASSGVPAPMTTSSPATSPRAPEPTAPNRALAESRDPAG